MAASPIIVATDLRNMSAIQREILFNKEMIQVHQVEREKVKKKKKKRERDRERERENRV